LHFEGAAHIKGSVPESIEKRITPRLQMSAHAASYPVAAVDTSTSGAAYITEPTLVCCR